MKSEEGNTNVVALVILVIILVAIGAVAVVTNINRSAYQTAATSTVANASSSTDMATSSEITGTISTGGSATTNTKTTKTTVTPAQKTVKTQSPSGAPQTINVYIIQSGTSTSATVAGSSSGSSATNQTTYKGPSFRLCSANDLTGMAHWQGATGALYGTLTLTNSSNTPCSLSHDDYLQILNGTNVLPVGQVANASASAYTDLGSGDSTDMNFLWRNWCGSGFSGTAFLRFIMPSNGGYLRVPVIDANGNNQTDTPRCDATGTYSSVAIWL